MKAAQAAPLLPQFLLRHWRHFEVQIGDAVARFAASLPEGARLLDAGAGEAQYRRFFSRQRYTGVDLGIGDTAWDYSTLDAQADLAALPFAAAAFHAAINIVTLEHVRYPARVIAELFRVLEPGGALFLVAPFEWEEHQQPHDYYRFTRYALRDLLTTAGFAVTSIQPVGGIFRLLSRRILAAAEFLPFPLDWIYLLLMGVPALVLPLLDGMDHRQNFTLGYICFARKRS